MIFSGEVKKFTFFEKNFRVFLSVTMKITEEGLFLQQQNQNKFAEFFFPKEYFQEFNFSEEVIILLPSFIKQSMKIFSKKSDFSIEIEKKKKRKDSWINSIKLLGEAFSLDFINHNMVSSIEIKDEVEKEIFTTQKKLNYLLSIVDNNKTNVDIFSNEEDEASFKVSPSQFFSIDIGEWKNFLATLSRK